MFFNILPSHYRSLLPPSDLNLDDYAKNAEFPSVDGLIPALWYTVLFGILRIILTRIAFKPLAIFAMKLKIDPFQKNPKIEDYIAKNKLVPAQIKEVKDIAIVASISEADVNKYLWDRRRYSAAKKRITKFVEAIWRFLFYAYFCYLGIHALFVPETAPWVTDTKQHWIGWPLQVQSNVIQSSAIIFYYQIELGSYIHQAMWTEVNRSDAAEMLLHHFATILLIMMSYLTNFTRIGASILLVHDLADIFLESGKCFVYASKAKGQEWMSVVCDTFFAIFAIAFFITRLIIYPRYLVYSLVVEAPEVMGMWTGYWAFAALLIVLQCLHVFWFYLIVRMIFKLLTTGIEKDERSDDDEGIDLDAEGSSEGKKKE